jgi:hypothetical protein
VARGHRSNSKGGRRRIYLGHRARDPEYLHGGDGWALLGTEFSSLCDYDEPMKFLFEWAGRALNWVCLGVIAFLGSACSETGTRFIAG